MWQRLPFFRSLSSSRRAVVFYSVKGLRSDLFRLPCGAGVDVVMRNYGNKKGSLDKSNYGLLKNLLTAYRVSYEKGEPLIPDQEYDSLYQDLLDIEKSHPELCDPSSPSQQVSPALNDTVAKRHHLPMLGLQNTYNNEQIKKFESKIQRGIASRDVSSIPIEYVTEMKYDGMAVSLIFKNGEFQHALSRGDGLYGEDLTRNFLCHVNNLPFTIVKGKKTLGVSHTTEIVEIRGEIVCSTAEFNRINSERKSDGLKEFSTPRNRYNQQTVRNTSSRKHLFRYDLLFFAHISRRRFFKCYKHG